MKRVLSVGLWVVLVVFMLTACATSKEKITKIEDLKDKTLGTIVWFGTDDDQIKDIFTKGYQVAFAGVKSFESESAVVMALDSGKISAAWFRDFQAAVYAKNKNKYLVITTESDKLLGGSARMAAQNSDTGKDKVAKINAAIAQLKKDGTLDALKQTYVDDFTFKTNFESIKMPKIDGAPTWKVSVSGSMVPLDYIASDGKPTGFSIALLSKISEMAKINFELVTVGFGADRMEIKSGKIDLIFCYTLMDANLKTETELVFSDPYFTYAGTAMLVKK